MKEPFFIVGCVRSGTTLMRDILRTHPGLDCPEETNFFRWGDPFSSVRYDSICQIEILKTHRRLDGVTEAEFASLYEQATDRRDLADRYGEVFLAKQGNAGARWFDKTPQNVYGMLLISALYPGVKFIHIHRNPLNVVASLVEGKVMRAHSVKGGVNYWNESMHIINRFKEAWGDQVFEFSYESLTTNPEENIAKLLGFVGEDPSGIKGSAKMVRPEKNKYLKVLSEDDIRYVKKHCQPFLEQYGYC